MSRYEGKAVFKGTAMGKILVLKKRGSEIQRKEITDPDAEIARVHDAVRKGKVQLRALYDKALKEIGEEGAAIFEVHQMLMEDEGFRDAIASLISTENVCAEYAVSETGRKFSQKFAAMEDECFRARSADILDIAERLTDILMGNESDLSAMTEPVIIIAEDLTPSETMSMDRSKILAIATVGGTTASHTAILAGMMSIPALIGCESMDISTLKTGTMAIVDGNAGTVIFDPDPEECLKAADQIRGENEERRMLDSVKGLENVTKSGKKIDIYANIGDVSDYAYVVESDAAGVGLFRSEFLYLGRDSLPTEEEQFNAYSTAARTLGNRPVIIRTLDLGSDKKAEYLNLGDEENPALGYRAIRICLTRTDIFRTQLRALLRAAVYGNIEIMYPMIISVNEVKRIRAFVEKIAAELEAEGKPCRIPNQGIMIETPAAVIIADDLAKEVDFFSVGTNDLTQYTLAIDRQNNNLGDFFDPHHPAILKMLRMVADAAHANGIRAGICGELGADPELLPYFMEIGYDEISVSPSSVLKLRKIVREMD